MNTYDGITDCYDLLMRAGYYDHDEMAKAADAVVGERNRVLELGVGTGLFAQSLAEVKPECEITGVDFTPAMLDIAQERVSDDTELIEADVTNMDLGRSFETAISSGGVWVVIRDEDEYMLGTHLYDVENDLRGLQNVARHLEADGLLLLSIQDMHRDFDQELEGGVTYRQRISSNDDPADEHFTIDKHYQFSRGSEVIAEEELQLGFYRRSMMDQMLSEAGLSFEGTDPEERFFVWSKEAADASA